MKANLPHRKLVKHIDEPREAHSLTFSCYHRLPLLTIDRTRCWLIESISGARQIHTFELWAWVFMPEHVHLLILPTETDYHTERILQSIKRPVGQKEMKYLKVHDAATLSKLTVMNRNREYHHFWQVGPGFDRNLTGARAIHHTIDYIHNNPVRRGLVTRAEDWWWSSARDWAGLDCCSLRIDRTVPTLHPFD